MMMISCRHFDSSIISLLSFHIIDTSTLGPCDGMFYPKRKIPMMIHHHITPSISVTSSKLTLLSKASKSTETAAILDGALYILIYLLNNDEMMRSAALDDINQEAGGCQKHIKSK